MQANASDTKVPLEWNDEAEYWTFPLIEQEWADFKGMMSRGDAGYSQISPEKYHLERSPGGEYRILWTAPQDQRPDRVYGLVAVRPKKPGTFLGVPLAVVVPIITALATAAGTIAVQAATNRNNSVDIAEICGGSSNWTPAAEFSRCESELTTLKSANETLKGCRNQQQVLHEFILPRPREHRSLYVLGYSHGQRLEAIRNLPLDATLIDIALQAEETYVKNVLAGDDSILAFTKGKSDGQEQAIKLLGLGDLQVLSGEDLRDMR